MSSTMLSRRDDDALDFAFAHHAKGERASRCFNAFGRHFCARCSGACLGALAYGAPLILGGGSAAWFFPLLPAPAFIDWSGRKLGFFKSGRPAAFATGALLGAGWVGYAMAIPRFDLAAIASAPIYAIVFVAVALACRRRVRGSPRGPSAGSCRPRICS
jgi:uncharacterized membrane protein